MALAASAGEDQNGARTALRWLTFVGIAAQAALIAYLFGKYQIESRTFQRLVPAIFVGFLVHHALPLRFRLPFFVALSLGLSAWVLGIVDTVFSPLVSLQRMAVLVGLGGGLIALCHLPVRFAARVAALIAAGCGIAAARVAFSDAPAAASVWPILGAMFMFRLAVYAYDIEHEKNPPKLSRSLAYFFMLPNVCFTLFPVVDYKTFARSHYAGDELRIYQRGVQWMARGLLQILAWRLVYYHVHLDAGRVADGTDLVRFVVSNVLLYLRVSGSFHLIVGMLHLFGFALPLTNRRYFLASSFNDYWRRVNIYWKDFIMKLVYYPVVFALKSWGPTRSLVFATAFAFAVSWILHDYQLFWLRGDFPLKTTDMIFWGTLGVFMVINSVVEMKRGRTATLGKHKPTAAQQARMVAGTLFTFTVMTLLWSMWNADSLEQWFSILALADLATLGWSVVVLAVVAVAALIWGGDGGNEPALSATRAKSAAVSAPIFSFRNAWVHAPLAVLLLVVGARSTIGAKLGPQTEMVLASLTWTRPNAADDEREKLGYYDNAIEVSRVNRQFGDAMGGPPAHWQREIESTEAARLTGAFPLTELVPSRETVVNGIPITTNRFGMRDRDYEQAKPPGTYRIGLVGSSGEMGWGVGNGETYESIAESRLEREPLVPGGPRIEVLNFGVNGYAAIETPAVIASRVAPFAPDAIVYGAHAGDRYFVMSRLAKSLRLGVVPPEPFLVDLAKELDIDANTPETWALRRLTPRSDELFARSYERMVEEARKLGAKPIWLWVPLPKSGADDEREEARMRALAEAAGFTTLSLTGGYGDVDPEALVVAPWDGHPNAKGHALLGDALYEALDSPQGRAALGIAPATTSAAAAEVKP